MSVANLRPRIAALALASNRSGLSTRTWLE
ncbi:hypothetical protein V6Z11_A08G043100 [Gossypium hirsutum]